MWPAGYPISPAAKSKFMVGPGIMVYSFFFWYHLKDENVYFKNLPGDILLPLSIFFLFNDNFALWDENTIKDRITILFFQKGFLRSRNKIMMLF